MFNSQKPISNRLQHIVPALAVLALSVVVAYLSWTQKPVDVFVFPRLVSVFFVALAIWNTARAVLGLARVGTGWHRQEALNLVPGVIVMIVLVFWAGKFLGFYTASAVAFVCIATFYDPAKLTSGRAWLVRMATTLVFCGVMFLLFSVLLKVQTPKGLFF